jgi:hypothetical protein
MPNPPPSHQSPKLSTMPTPIKGNVDAIHETLMGLKQAVEQLQGTRGHQPTTRTFVIETVPTAVVVGDQWVQPSTGKMSYWDGSAWRLIKGG